MQKKDPIAVRKRGDGSNACRCADRLVLCYQDWCATGVKDALELQF